MEIPSREFEPLHSLFRANSYANTPFRNTQEMTNLFVVKHKTVNW